MILRLSEDVPEAKWKSKAARKAELRARYTYINSSRLQAAANLVLSSFLRTVGRLKSCFKRCFLTWYFVQSISILSTKAQKDLELQVVSKQPWLSLLRTGFGDDPIHSTPKMTESEAEP